MLTVRARKAASIALVLLVGGIVLIVIVTNDTKSYFQPDTSFVVNQEVPHSRYHPLDVQGTAFHVSELSGAQFFGADERTVSGRVNVSLVHSYSPYTERHFREMMIDPVREEHPIYANSPAILMTADGHVITVMRVWLEKEYWTINKKHPHNTFSDNYFYIQLFDRAMIPKTPGRILGIPTPIQWSIGDGPIEPRLFSVNDTLYLTFNTGIYTKESKTLDTTFFWDLTHDRSLIPHISDGQPMVQNPQYNTMPRDKHWSPIVDGTDLYFTYNLDPLRVMKCDMTGQVPRCHFVHKEGPDDYNFRDQKDHLRGGTPFVLYKYPYYISIAHGTFFKNCNGDCSWSRYYTVHLTIIKIKPDFKIVYTSENIMFPPTSMQLPIVRQKYIKDTFIFPVGLLLESEDSIIIGGHINDYASVLFRMTGISSIMEQVMKNEETNPNFSGPPYGHLQKYIERTAIKQSGYTFHSSG